MGLEGRETGASDRGGGGKWEEMGEGVSPAGAGPNFLTQGEGYLLSPSLLEHIRPATHPFVSGTLL